MLYRQQQARTKSANDKLISQNWKARQKYLSILAITKSMMSSLTTKLLPRTQLSIFFLLCLFFFSKWIFESATNLHVSLGVASFID